VHTNFIDWCSQVFTTQIYGTLYGEHADGSDAGGSDSIGGSSLVDSSTAFTTATPTDWALHTHEGVKQRGAKESELVKSGAARCETLCMSVRTERTITGCAWSFLRPYVYLTDGETILLYHSESCQRKLAFSAIRHNEFLLKDAVSDLMVANELTHELLLSGTRNGLLKVWDPMFHEHSHEITQPSPKLITAAYLLNDVPRVGGKQENETLYW
jgi:hypothetical protein